MNVIPTAPAFDLPERKSRRLVNPEETRQRIESLVDQVRVLTDLYNLLVEDINEARRAKTTKNANKGASE
jgi:hypothetical protein